MAAENIQVFHEGIRTAFFDMKERVLHVPDWKDTSPELYDLLMGHEVGHALNTPAEGWHDAIMQCKENHAHDASCFDENFKFFLNVCEDARIEKKIKNKFPGLRKSFVQGYKELFDRDFFGVKDIDLNELNLIDRINLYFKIGALVGVQFNKKEKDFVRRLDEADTFEQVLKLAREIYVACQQERGAIQNLDDLAAAKDGTKKGKRERGDGQDGEEGEAQDGQSSDAEGQDPNEQNDGEDQKSSNVVDAEQGSPDHGKSKVKPTAVTDKIFRQKEKELMDTSSHSVANVTLPRVNHNKMIYDVNNVVSFFEAAIQSKLPEYHNRSEMLLSYFMKKHRDHINVLVKEFEMKKDARQYYRAQTHRSGELDMRRLSQYKFTSDVFRRITEVPKGKSHGMIMFLDMSGSMNGDYMFHSIEQIIILTAFCQKVKIPFDVYGFADRNDYGSMPTRKGGAKFSSMPRDLPVHSPGFHLRHLMSSNIPASLQRRAYKMLSFFAAVHSLSAGMDPQSEEYQVVQKGLEGFSHSTTTGLSMSGTPLSEAVMTSRTMIEEFKMNTKVDIVNVIYLTDGAGNGINLPSAVRSETCQKNLTKVIITDPITGQFVSSDAYDYVTLQASLTELVKQITGCRHIGYYICSSNEIEAQIRNRTSTKDEQSNREKMKNLKEYGFVAMPVLGFDNYYYVSTKFMGYEDDFTSRKFENTQTKKGQDVLQKAFTNHQQMKKASRIILSQFAQDISTIDGLEDRLSD